MGLLSLSYFYFHLFVKLGRCLCWWLIISLMAIDQWHFLLACLLVLSYMFTAMSVLPCHIFLSRINHGLWVLRICILILIAFYFNIIILNKSLKLINSCITFIFLLNNSNSNAKLNLSLMIFLTVYTTHLII